MQSAIVVVVGSSNTDLVVQTPRIPVPGETVIGAGLMRAAGGKGANQAVAAARLGAAVTFIARVGDDDFGAAALAGFVAEGIDTAFVRTTEAMASGVALIAVDSGTGENAILVSPGANAALSPADVDSAASVIAAADILILSLEIPIETVLRAAEIAAQHGVPVVLNPAPARPLPPELLAHVSLLTPNETEARQLCGLADDETAAHTDVADRLRQNGVETVVLTLGPLGALIATAAGFERSPAFAVRAVDTVAAGDCFTAALAVEIASGRKLTEAVRFANAAAALKVTRSGAQPGLPTRAEVEAFLHRL